MAEVEQYTFSHKEIVELLVKAAGVHEGHWMLQTTLSLGGGNVGQSPNELMPVGIVMIQKIGIQRLPAGMPPENSLTVDAAKVNPAVKEEH